MDGVNCQRCGSEIPAKRLAAVPSAARCAPCQSRYDLSPVEQFGSRVFDALAVMGEMDGEAFGAPMYGGREM